MRFDARQKAAMLRAQKTKSPLIAQRAFSPNSGGERLSPKKPHKNQLVNSRLSEKSQIFSLHFMLPHRKVGQSHERISAQVCRAVDDHFHEMNTRPAAAGLFFP